MTPADPAPSVSEYLHDFRGPDPAKRDKAAAEIYKYLMASLYAVAQKRAALTDGGLAASELFHDTWLKLWVDGFPATTTTDLRRAFCTILYQKTIDHLRRQKTAQRVLFGRPPAGTDETPAAAAERADVLTVICQAVAALEGEQPDLADALKARLLADSGVRFTVAGVRGGAADAHRTFAEMATILGCSTTVAHARYKQAARWLLDRYPHLAPEAAR